MPYKNIEDKRRYQREWLRRKNAGLPTRLTVPNSPEERERLLKERRRRTTAKRRQRRRKYRDEYVGGQCYFCGYPERLIVHRKDGEPHTKPSEWGLKKYHDEVKTGMYATLCYKCHKHVHWCMTILGLTWEEMAELKRGCSSKEEQLSCKQ